MFVEQPLALPGSAKNFNSGHFPFLNVSSERLGMGTFFFVINSSLHKYLLEGICKTNKTVESSVQDSKACT